MKRSYQETYKKLGYGDNSIICKQRLETNREMIPSEPGKIQAIEEKIIELGKRAFKNGLPHAPITDMDFMDRLSNVSGIEARERASNLWSKGWIIESLMI